MSEYSSNAAVVAEACTLGTAAIVILVSVCRRRRDRKVLYRLVVNGQEQIENGEWSSQVEPLRGRSQFRVLISHVWDRSFDVVYVYLVLLVIDCHLMELAPTWKPSTA